MHQCCKDNKPRDLWQELCSKENLFLAYLKARKHKTKKPYVIEFEKKLKSNLDELRTELLLHSYRPKPLETFLIRDPKTRKISKSHFRDRVVHHAICNILEPIFDKTFIYDSYANRKGKGTLMAIERFNFYKKKCSRNFTGPCFVLKADIKHYFDSVSHQKLLSIIGNKINDPKILWLIRIILENHKVNNAGKGMPLGNLTSQYFANVYLNELDQYVKKTLKARFYIRYVDDFVILANNCELLFEYRKVISEYLEKNLDLELHPEKSKVTKYNLGISFLGFRVFPRHIILKKSNLRIFKKKFQLLYESYNRKDADRTKAYDFYEGWSAFARRTNTFKLRKGYSKAFDKYFGHYLCSKEIAKYDKIKLRFQNL